MAYPTKESNDKEGGSPSQAESDRLGQYVEDTKDYDEPDHDDDSVGAYVEREHPHMQPDNRKAGDHPHKDLSFGKK